MPISCKKITTLLLSASFLYLTGCVNVSTPPAQSSVKHRHTPWSKRSQTLTALDSWRVEGAFSFRNPTQKIIASYDWKQTKQNYQIALHSSLNLYNATLAGSPKQVTFWRDSKRVESARNPERLMQKRLNWSLPVSQLFYWIRGLPAPGHYQADFDAEQRLKSLNQLGWSIQYPSYISVGSLDLPNTIYLSNQHTLVKIVVKHWGV
jgi:outer membrane lipoprotein LolB